MVKINIVALENDSAIEKPLFMAPMPAAINGYARHVQLTNWCNHVNDMLFRIPQLDKETTLLLYSRVLHCSFETIWHQLTTLTNTELPHTNIFDKLSISVSFKDGVDHNFLLEDRKKLLRLSGAYVRIEKLMRSTEKQYYIVFIYDKNDYVMEVLCMDNDLIDNFATRWYTFKMWLFVHPFICSSEKNLSVPEREFIYNNTTVGALRSWYNAYIGEALKILSGGDESSESYLMLAHRLCYKNRSLKTLSIILDSDPIIEAQSDCIGDIETLCSENGLAMSEDGWKNI